MTQTERKETQLLPKMKLNGIVRGGGGDYETVEVDGLGRLTGDVRAASHMRMNGVITMEGRVTAYELAMDGKMNVEGGLRAGSAHLNGLVKVGGSIMADSFRMNGMLTADGSLEAEKLDFSGVVSLRGLINAGTVEIGLSHKESQVAEIGGETITVKLAGSRKWSWLWEWAVPQSKPILTAALIEGDDVQLEHTYAEVVRGHRVRIGQGCQIGRVEYRDELTVHPEAFVRKEERTGD